MSRKNKSGNRRGNGKNYRPISESFCNSVVNSKKNNDLVEDPNNKYVLIYNSDKTAHITREFDVGGTSLLGFKVETKDVSYTIDSHKNVFDIVVEMLNFGFTYSQIKGLLNITHKQYETYKPKDFTSMNDFIFVLSLVPKTLYRCNDVLHYVKQIPDMIVDNPSVDTLSIAMGITKNQAKKCLDMYKAGRYGNLIGEAKKRKAEQKKLEEKEAAKKAEKEATQKEEVTEIVIPSVEDTVVVDNVVEETMEVMTVSVDTEFKDSQNVNADDMILENIETSEIEATDTEVNVADNESSESVDEVEYLEDNEVTESTAKKPIKADVSFSMDDYQTALGFAGIPFDFNIFVNEIKNYFSNKSFSEYIEETNKEGISNLLYPLIYMNNAYAYSREFTLAEDKLLETYYKDIGKAVIKVMETVIPDYQVRPDYEYILRIRERGIKCPHPVMGFGLLREDENLIKTLYPKVKKSPTKYFSWLDSFDLFYYVAELGVGENTSKKTKKLIDLESLDMQAYIDSALKLKEVMYHSDFWTTDKHELFKEEFKLNGIKVMEKIPGLSETECLEHAKQYKIFQNYTIPELEKMKIVYIESGIEGVVKEFPYRTETALRYKIEEEGWEVERRAALMEKEIEKRVQEQVRLETEQIKKEIIETESIRIRESLIEELTPTIRENVVNDVYTLIKGPVFHGIKVEMPNLVRKSALKDLPSVLPQKIVTKLESLVKEEMNNLK